MSETYDVMKFVPAPDPDFVCSICHGVLDNPVESSCRHIFCRACIERWLDNRHNCPTCREQVLHSDLKSVSVSLTNSIKQLCRVCVFENAGCAEILTLELFFEHIKTCDFEPIQCRFSKCKQSLPRKDIGQHEGNCDFRELECEKGCDLMVLVRAIRTHDCIHTLKLKLKDEQTGVQTLADQKEDLRKMCQRLKRKVSSLKKILREFREQGNHNQLLFHTFPLSTSGPGSSLDSSTDSSADLEGTTGSDTSLTSDQSTSEQDNSSPEIPSHILNNSYFDHTTSPIIGGSSNSLNTEPSQIPINSSEDDPEPYHSENSNRSVRDEDKSQIDLSMVDSSPASVDHRMSPRGNQSVSNEDMVAALDNRRPHSLPHEYFNSSNEIVVLSSDNTRDNLNGFITEEDFSLPETSFLRDSSSNVSTRENNAILSSPFSSSNHGYSSHHEETGNVSTTWQPTVDTSRSSSSFLHFVSSTRSSSDKEPKLAESDCSGPTSRQNRKRRILPVRESSSGSDSSFSSSKSSNTSSSRMNVKLFPPNNPMTSFSTSPVEELDSPLLKGSHVLDSSGPPSSGDKSQGISRKRARASRVPKTNPAKKTKLKQSLNESMSPSEDMSTDEDSDRRTSFSGQSNKKHSLDCPQTSADLSDESLRRKTVHKVGKTGNQGHGGKKVLPVTNAALCPSTSSNGQGSRCSTRAAARNRAADKVSKKKTHKAANADLMQSDSNRNSISVRKHHKGSPVSLLDDFDSSSSDSSWKPDSNHEGTDVTVLSEEFDSESSSDAEYHKTALALMDELAAIDDDSDSTWSPIDQESP